MHLNHFTLLTYELVGVCSRILNGRSRIYKEGAILASKPSHCKTCIMLCDLSSGCYHLCRHTNPPEVVFFLHILISQKKPKDVEHINAVCSQQYKSEELPRAATYRPTPHCEELTPSAGPECTSNRGPKIIGVGADFSLNCSTSNILTQDFIAVSRKGITPDSPLTGMGESVCVRTAVSQKACCQCIELKMSTCKFYWHFKWWGNSEVMNSFFDIFMWTPPSYSNNLWVTLCVHYTEM